MKKIFAIILLFFITSISFAKVKVIEDEFYGTEYYQTDHVNIDYAKSGLDWCAQIRFRTSNGDKNTIIMGAAIIYLTSSVFSLDKALIRCENNHIIEVEPNSIIDKVSDVNKSFSYTTSALQAVQFEVTLTDKDIEGIKSGANMLRLEFRDSFKNIDISKNESKNITKKLDELLKKINN